MGNICMAAMWLALSLFKVVSVVSYLYWNTKGFSGKTEPKVFIYFQFIGREMKTEQNEKVKQSKKSSRCDSHTVAVVVDNVLFSCFCVSQRTCWRWKVWTWSFQSQSLLPTSSQQPDWGTPKQMLFYIRVSALTKQFKPQTQHKNAKKSKHGLLLRKILKYSKWIHTL